MRLSLIALAAAPLLAAGAANAAVIHLTYTHRTHTDGAPVVDTDGQNPLADIDWMYQTIPLDIRVFSLDGTERVGGEYRFEFAAIDGGEIFNLVKTANFSNVTVSGSPGSLLSYLWLYSGSETVGTVLASVNVHLRQLGIRPDDDRGDLLITASSDGLEVWDPVQAVSVSAVAYDAQTIPLPAGVFLLGGALVGLGALRRRGRRGCKNV